VNPVATSERPVTAEEPSDEHAGDRAAGSGDFDPLAYLQSAVTERKSVRGFAGLTARSLALARRASPRIFWLNLSLSLCSAGLLLVQVLLGKLILQDLLGTGHSPSLETILPLVVALAAATALSGLATSSGQLLQRLLGEEVQRLTWDGVIDVTTHVPLETFEDPEFFDALQRVKTNAVLRPLTLSQGLVQVMSGLLGIVGLTLALVLIQPVLVAVLLAGGPLLWLISRTTGRVEFRFRVGQTTQLRLNEYLISTLSGREESKEIRAFDLGPVLKRRWGENYAGYLADYRAHIRRRLALGGLGALVTTVVTSASLGVLVWLIVSHRIGVADGGAALIAVRLLGGNLQQVFFGVGELFESALFLRDHDEFLARRPAPGRPGRPGQPSVHPAPRARVAPFAQLSLRDVGFRYPGASTWALREVSLTLHAGETIALVGENGSGKTTLAKLLGQLYAPTRGEILWDGTSTAGLDAAARRAHVGVIFQDFVRYQLSARENIGFGRTDRLDDLAAVHHAAEQAGADRFLQALPAGYETGLGKQYQGGFDLSGGQWQRVALARAFFRDASLLVLDEPTASMDARSEHQLFEHVRRLEAGRTLVLISHRFSTVRGADRIYVLDKGRIIEHGTHAELMELGGRYAELFELQASAYR
jgi:ATP-binding cassette, subfamily B, bacterial